VLAAVLALGMAAVPPAALAQGDDDLGIGGDDDSGIDEGIGIGDDDDVGIGGDDVTGDDTGDDIGSTVGDDDGGGSSEEVAALDEGPGAGPKESDVRAEGQRQTFLGMLNMGGPLMYVLLGIQIVVLTLVLESCFNVNALKVLPVDLVESIEDDFEKNDVDAVVTKCEENPGMLANVLHAGLTAPSPTEGDVKEAIELAGEHEGESFMSHVGYLSIFGVIAPMVGLLGTVTGMILAFRNVAYEAAIGKPQLLAAGIYQALLTTAFGLIIGIPAMFMYYYFKNRGIKILMVVENSVKRFMKWRSQPDNTGVPRGGLVPQRLSLLVDEALSNAFVGIMPVVGFILGPFAIAKSVKIKAELREVGGNPGGALAVEPWKATMAFVLGIVDIILWPLAAVLAVVFKQIL
jgi:biopolymer transport protein ExbB